MHPSRSRVLKAAGLSLGLALSACHAPSQPAASAGSGTAPRVSPAPPAVQSVLNLYSGSLTGLVVGAAPDGGNPGAVLTGQSFVSNPGLPGTYIWAFTPDAAILDRDCHPVTVTQAINIANAPIANAARFDIGADSRPAAPIRVQLWAKSAGTPPSCGAAPAR